MKTTLKSLDRCHTRMLHVVLNVSKSAHVTNDNLYDGILKVGKKTAD